MTTGSRRMISARGRALLTRTVLCCLSAAAPLAQAQEAQNEQAGQSGQLEEVIVTAQKRSENLRDVPVSISAITASDLAEQHIESTDDLTRAVPGFSFFAAGSSAGVGSDSPQIRGIGSSQGQATVGVYVDDVPVTQINGAGAFSPMLFDLDRVEVLRGPQGTLFGASSEGGTVRYITNQPDLNNFSGLASANVSHTEHGAYNTEDSLVLNVPIVSGVFGVRVGGEFTDNSGWINRYANEPDTILTPSNVLLQSGTNAEHDYAVRLIGTYQPDDSLTITPSVSVQRQHQNDTPVFYLGAGLYNESNVVPEPATDEGLIGSLTIEKHFEVLDLTSVSSYFRRDYTRQRDGTYYDSGYVVPYILDYDPRTAAEAPIANDTLGILPVYTTDTDKGTSYTQELRLSSPSATGSKLNWVIGAYFAYYVDRNYHYELAPGWNALFQSIYGFSVNNPVLSPLADPNNPNAWENDFYINNTRTADTQTAGFGQVDYEILPQLRASVGLRYQVSDVTYSYHGAGFYNIGEPTLNDARTSDSNLTPKFSLTYAVSPTANVYATASKGYRDGGYNLPVPVSCSPDETSAPQTSYRPDDLWNYEVGFKALLADRTLSINADLYELKWSQIQQLVRVPVCGFDYITNVGQATAYGTEMELQYKLPFVQGLTLGVNAGAEHAYVTAAAPNTPAQNGEDLLFVPQWTGTVSATYTRPIAAGLSLALRADNYWQGRSSGDFDKTASDYVNEPYSVLNASVGIITDHGLEVGLFSKNLLDNTTVIRSPNIALVVEAYTVPPRMIGLQVKQKF